MSGQPWYKRYPKDFINGSIGMSLEEKGAYSLILDLIYEHGKPIVDDARYISGVLGCTVKKWNAIREQLIAREKIFVEEGRIFNERAKLELKNSAEISAKLSQNGAKGGQKSAQNRAVLIENNNIVQAPLNHHARQDTDTDKKEETHLAVCKENPPDAVASAPPAPDLISEKPKRQKPRQRLADDFIPPETWRDFALSKGFSEADAARMWHSFRDHHLAAGSVFLDWFAAWRKWVNNDLKFQAERQRREQWRK